MFREPVGGLLPSCLVSPWKDWVCFCIWEQLLASEQHIENDLCVRWAGRGAHAGCADIPHAASAGRLFQYIWHYQRVPIRLSDEGRCNQANRGDFRCCLNWQHKMVKKSKKEWNTRNKNTAVDRWWRILIIANSEQEPISALMQKKQRANTRTVAVTADMLKSLKATTRKV